jgi:hypothetical protein
MLKRWTLAIGVAAAMLAGAALGPLSVSAETPSSQPSYTGNCRALPSGSTCLEFEDGFIWLVQDTITTSGRNHGPIQMFYGARANYAHVLGTDLVWLLPV